MKNSRTYGLNIATCLLPAVVLLCMSVNTAVAQSFTYKDEQGVYYLCDENTMEAVLIASQDASKGYTYKQSSLTIPAAITVSSSSLGSGGGSQSEEVYAVTEIGEEALKGSWAFHITFADNSHIRIIRRRGMYNISCTGTLTLPASLRVIEEEGIYAKSAVSAPQFISTLVLPAGLDSLGKSAIVLNKLQTLQFLGTTPPKCHYTESSNPWTADDNATPKDVQIEIPAGTDDAYSNRKGIGNYFSFFPGVPTGTEEMQDDAGLQPAAEDGARKVLLGGRVLILRDGRFYTMLGRLLIDN